MNSTRAEFVDTNIFVYAYDRSAGDRHVRASKLVADLWARGSGMVSIQVLQELYVCLTRKIPKPLNSDRAEERIRHLALWRMVAPDSETVLTAIRLSRRFGIAFWDGMIVACAALGGAQVLWSEDLAHDTEYGGVRVQNPFLA